MYKRQLKSLVTQGRATKDIVTGVFVAGDDTLAWREQVALLRSQGERVVQGFVGQKVNFTELNCDRELVEQDGQFVIKKLS